MEEVHKDVKEKLSFFDTYRQSTFRFDVDCFGNHPEHEEKVRIIQEFDYTMLEGKVLLKGPVDIIYSVKIHFQDQKYYFGRLIGGSQRDLIDAFHLKKRKYLGITSMDAELSLIMSNLALVKKGQLVLDPFVGTGSFLYTTSAFGAYSMGCDIDGRQLRGSGEGSFQCNLQQYGLQALVLGGCVMDMKHHAWRDGLKFDALVTDPPYGVRAGARKIGGFDTNRPNLIPKDKIYRMTRYPKTVAYETPELVGDLFEFGVRFLKSKGRLVFWYPVEGNDRINFDDSMLPRDDRYDFMAGCLQNCQGFDRWLVVYQLKH